MGPDSRVSSMPHPAHRHETFFLVSQSPTGLMGKIQCDSSSLQMRNMERTQRSNNNSCTDSGKVEGAYCACMMMVITDYKMDKRGEFRGGLIGQLAGGEKTMSLSGRGKQVILMRGAAT